MSGLSGLAWTSDLNISKEVRKTEGHTTSVTRQCGVEVGIFFLALSYIKQFWSTPPVLSVKGYPSGQILSVMWLCWTFLSQISFHSLGNALCILFYI